MDDETGSPSAAPSPLRAARAARQERSRVETRARIEAAAMQLFLDEGFERTSIRRIADAIGYTPGAIYSYFEDKDDILFALHETGFATLRTLLESMDLTFSARERLHRVGVLYLRFAFEHPQLYDLMFIMTSTARKIREHERWDTGLDTYDFLRAIVADCMRDGVLPPGDLESATFAIWSSVHGIAALVIRGRCPMIEDDALPIVVEQGYEWMIRTLAARSSARDRARPGTTPRRPRA